MRKFTIAGALASMLISTAAFAGDQYVDETGYAVSGYDVVAYFSLPQSAVGTAQTEAVRGSVDYVTEYNGAKFAFSSADNLAAFEADPEKYVPAFDGHCAYGAAQGGKVPGNPHLWRIVDDTLYLNITKNVVGFWEEDIPGNIVKADANWEGGLEPAPASENTIPQYTSPGPVTH